jgi:toxin CcdB
MAQFDVHRNIGRFRETVPFLVIVQSSQFSNYRRRIVVPLVKENTIGVPLLRSLNPKFTIRNLRVVLHPLDLVSIPADQLGECVGSLGDRSGEVITALDEVFTRAWK